MSPEQQQIQELQRQVKQLTDFMMAFENSQSVAPNHALTIAKLVSKPSTKTAGSATRAVNEGGIGTYNVMNAPDGFIRIGAFNVPYIN